MIDCDRIPEHARYRDLKEVIDITRKLFHVIFEKATADLEPQDLIRFILMSDALDKPISTCLMRVSDITPETFLIKVMNVLQSKDEVRLDEGFNVNIMIIRRPVGGGRTRRVLIPDHSRIDKRSIIQISNEDNLNVCCAKAILLGKAYIGRDPELNTLRRQDCNLLTRKALKLHSDLSIKEGPCGFEEISIFERYLNVQVIVISSEKMNRVSIQFFFYK